MENKQFNLLIGIGLPAMIAFVIIINYTLK